MEDKYLPRVRPFVAISWTPSVYMLGNTSAFTSAFRATIPEAQGTIEAAIAELDLLSDELPIAEESGIAAELWEHIAPEIQAEAWCKVASQAVIFTEDRTSQDRLAGGVAITSPIR